MPWLLSNYFISLLLNSHSLSSLCTQMVPEGGYRLWDGETDINALLAAEEDFFREESVAPSVSSSVPEQLASLTTLSDSEGVPSYSVSDNSDCYDGTGSLSTPVNVCPVLYLLC